MVTRGFYRNNFDPLTLCVAIRFCHLDVTKAVSFVKNKMLYFFWLLVKTVFSNDVVSEGQASLVILMFPYIKPLFALWPSSTFFIYHIPSMCLLNVKVSVP